MLLHSCWLPCRYGLICGCAPDHCACRDASASVAPGSTISKGSLVGRGSTVEAGARLDRCAVGSDCHIGRGAVLQSSCLHAHVRADDGCRVASALLAEHVVVRSHAKLEVRLAAWCAPACRYRATVPKPHCCAPCLSLRFPVAVLFTVRGRPCQARRHRHCAHRSGRNNCVACPAVSGW